MQDGLPVDAAAADVDGDVPFCLQVPIFTYVCFHVSNQYLGLHLLTNVMMGASASTSRIIAEYFCYSF